LADVCQGAISQLDVPHGQAARTTTFYHLNLILLAALSCTPLDLSPIRFSLEHTLDSQTTPPLELATALT